MAIRLECIDLVVPIEQIRRRYPGGWEQCLADHASVLGGRVWYDDHLFRDGAMDGRVMRAMVHDWESKGFTAFKTVDGRRCWNELCVVEGMMMGPTLPCEWLVFDDVHMTAHLAGTAPGPVVGKRIDWPT